MDPETWNTDNGHLYDQIHLDSLPGQYQLTRVRHSGVTFSLPWNQSENIDSSWNWGAKFYLKNKIMPHSSESTIVIME